MNRKFLAGLSLFITAAIAASSFAVDRDVLAAAAASITASELKNYVDVLADDTFEGRETVSNLLAIVHEVIPDMEYTRHVADGDVEILVTRGTIGRQAIDNVVIYGFGEDDLIRDVTVLFRPLRAIAAFANAAGPKLAKSRTRARLLRAGSPALTLIAATTDVMSRRNVRMR